MVFDRKALLLASGILIAGGTAAYMQSRFRVNKHDLFGHCNGHNNDKEVTEEEVMKGATTPKSKQKRGGLKSLQVLAAIILSDMGKLGARDLLALVAVVVRLFCRGRLCFVLVFNFFEMSHNLIHILVFIMVFDSIYLSLKL